MLGGVTAVPIFSKSNSEIMLALVKKGGNLIWNLNFAYNTDTLVTRHTSVAMLLFIVIFKSKPSVKL